MEWIPRSQNDRADYLSRIIDSDDWGISNDLFNFIKDKFGHIEVDWFASSHNAKVNCFYSKFWNPGCAGVDAFAEHWGNRFGLFVPPVSVVHHVLKKMAFDYAKGVLVIPCWKSAIFWPLLCPNGTFIPQVTGFIDLPTSKNFFTKCKNGKGIFGNKDLNFNMVVLEVNFSDSH